MTASTSAGARPSNGFDRPTRDPVLIVDDDDSIRETMAEYLDLEGYQVLSAADGTSALTMLSSCRPCLLITDLSMPDVDGITLIQSARQHYPTLPAILLTGFAEQGSAHADAGDYYVLRKPVQMAQLLRLMTSLLNTVT